MRRFARSAAVSLLVALGIATPVSMSHAQPQAPGAFYEKDYAVAPRVAGGEMPAAQLSTPIPHGVTPMPGGAHTPAQRTGMPVSGKGDPTSPQLIPYRMSVRLYVASHDKRHFEQVMRKVFSLNAHNRNMRVTEVYHIGDERNVSATIKDDARAQKIYIGPLYHPPVDLNVESSPTWVLRDALTKSVHTVEGILEIDKCVTAQGEYRHPERSMFEAPAAPTIGVKGF